MDIKTRRLAIGEINYFEGFENDIWITRSWDLSRKLWRSKYNNEYLRLIQDNYYKKLREWDDKKTWTFLHILKKLEKKYLNKTNQMNQKINNKKGLTRLTKVNIQLELDW